MGIRFFCKNGHKLHVKSFLAGKTGICPECGVKVSIPEESVSLAAGRSDAAPADAMAANVAEKSEKMATSTAAIGGQWFVRTATGDQYGPATPELFESWISEGRVSSDCLVWRDDWDQWRPATSILSEPHPDPPEPVPTSPPFETPTGGSSPEDVGEIQIEPFAPPRRLGKRRSLTLVYVLLATCLVLLVPLIYVVTVKS